MCSGGVKTLDHTAVSTTMDRLEALRERGGKHWFFCCTGFCHGRLSYNMHAGCDSHLTQALTETAVPIWSACRGLGQDVCGVANTVS